MKYVKFGGAQLHPGQHTWYNPPDSEAVMQAAFGKLVPASDIGGFGPDYYVAAGMASFIETDPPSAASQPIPDNSVPGGFRFASDDVQAQVRAEKAPAPATAPAPVEEPAVPSAA